jgi:hypothetical protein
VGKAMYLVVILALLGTVRCYNADLAQSLAGVPIVGAMVSPPAAVPAYVNAIGTPSPTKLPEADPKKWFPSDPAADPYDPAMWAEIREFLANAGTQTGFAEVCKQLSTAAGADRSASPALGALACSADPSVTAVQGIGVAILAARAEVALWVKSAPGSSIGAIQARQSELPLLCSGDTVLRLGGAASPFGQACAKSLDAGYLAGDGAATFAALGDAYTLVAAELARRDPKTAAEPSFYGAPATKTP